MKVCPTPNCGTLVRTGKCTPCQQADRHRRGTTTQQGYGWEHQKRRARLLAELVDGTPCPICHRPMNKTDPLDAGHATPIAIDSDSIADRLECASCNRSAGGKLGHALHPD